MKTKIIETINMINYVYEKIAPIFLLHTEFEIRLKNSIHAVIGFKKAKSLISIIVVKTNNGFRIWVKSNHKPVKDLEELKIWYQNNSHKHSDPFGEFT